jgi:hypothetical protein
MDQIDQLKEVLQNFDRHKLTALLHQLNAADGNQEERPKRPKVDHGPIKSYTTVIKDYECLCCHTKFQVKYDFLKGEETTCFDKQGQVHIVRLTGKEGEITLQCFASRCDRCKDVIKGWSREHLEHAYISIINSSTFTEIVLYNTILEKGERPRI